MRVHKQRAFPGMAKLTPYPIGGLLLGRAYSKSRQKQSPLLGAQYLRKVKIGILAGRFWLMPLITGHS